MDACLTDGLPSSTAGRQSQGLAGRADVILPRPWRIIAANLTVSARTSFRAWPWCGPGLGVDAIKGRARRGCVIPHGGLAGKGAHTLSPSRFANMKTAGTDKTT